MQFLARLVLDRAGIILQSFDMSLKLLILILKPLQLFLQHPCVVALLLVGRNPVLPEDHVKAHADGKHRSRNRRDAPPMVVSATKPSAYTSQRRSLLTRWNYLVHMIFSSSALAPAVKWISWVLSAGTNFVSPQGCH